MDSEKAYTISFRGVSKPLKLKSTTLPDAIFEAANIVKECDIEMGCQWLIEVGVVKPVGYLVRHAYTVEVNIYDDAL